MTHYFNYIRRSSSVVKIGSVPLGGPNPIRVQSMANVSTMDTSACVEQAIQIIEAGGEYVRFTAQGVREAENLGVIKGELMKRGYSTPLIADIHFNPKAAEAAAVRIEKVRINPGNFVDGVKSFDEISYTDEEYSQEIEKIEHRLIPLLDLCKAHHTAIRIGVNHGSLSNRIMSRYGDTPEGMVESAMEFLRICVKEQFSDVVISIKASNVVIMVRTVRLLVDTMEKENMFFPLHLGVTEAGDGEDGRVKSAFGIGTLLGDGIGDTIRVSLSEDPVYEIPVARTLIDYILKREGHPVIEGAMDSSFNYYSPVRISRFRKRIKKFASSLNEIIEDLGSNSPIYRLQLSDLTIETLSQLRKEDEGVIVAYSTHQNGVGELRALLHKLRMEEIELPIVIEWTYDENDLDMLRVKAAADFGPLLLDGFGDGINIINHGSISDTEIQSCALSILQAARLRFSKTDYISCPGCGRTLFDLQSTIAQIKQATIGQPGLKIGIMGCIVNGPGEMADADYGYVGSGRGRIDLYKKNSCIEKNIPQEEAVERLIKLIKENGDWQE
ncbi:MAG: (E)-4-hydroxy-3-methylbut-2-enyl-diphosphate synthase [Bacteroidales bacterium]